MNDPPKLTLRNLLLILGIALLIIIGGFTVGALWGQLLSWLKK